MVEDIGFEVCVLGFGVGADFRIHAAGVSWGEFFGEPM